MVDLEQVADMVVGSCAGVSEGETVLVLGRGENLDFCERLALAALRRGGQPLVSVSTDDYAYRLLSEIPISMLERSSRHTLSLVRESDVVITVMITYADPSRFVGIPEERMAARRRAQEPLRELMLDNKRRWVGMDFPTPGQAKTYGVDYDTFASSFWRAMGIDYDALGQDCRNVADGLSRGSELRLSSPKGTDLLVVYESRPIMRDDGRIDAEDIANGDCLSNLPAGEVCLAPLETRAEGKLVVDLAFWQGHRIEDLELEFVKGRARPVSARVGFDVFCSVLSESKGDKDRIGELGIGLNPAVTQAVGYMLVDEKLRGSVHVALGANQMLGGVNQSDLHWDLLVLEPTITVGGNAIIERGRLMG